MDLGWEELTKGYIKREQTIKICGVAESTLVQKCYEVQYETRITDLIALLIFSAEMNSFL